MRRELGSSLELLFGLCSHKVFNGCLVFDLIRSWNFALLTYSSYLVWLYCNRDPSSLVIFSFSNKIVSYIKKGVMTCYNFSIVFRPKLERNRKLFGN